METTPATPPPFITECTVCGKEYRDGVGSTECCGAVQTVKFYHVSEMMKARPDIETLNWFEANVHEFRYTFTLNGVEKENFATGAVFRAVVGSAMRARKRVQRNARG